MKHSPSISVWIFASLCFLCLIGGVSVYLSSGSSSSRQEDATIQDRSVTLTDVGFDTPVTFQATCSEADYVRYLDILRDTFIECNALFDQYHAYEGVNNIYTLNHHAFEEPIKVDPRIIDCIEISMKAHAISDKLDITEGKVLSLWHDFRESENPVLPSQKDIEQALDHTGIEGVEIHGNTISFQDDTIWLDLGAVAKGYTAGLVRNELEAAGLDNGFINAGGNVVLIGYKANGKDWKVGIQKPDSNESLVRFTTSTPTCLVTSGDYQRYLIVDGVRYSHIIDPATGYPADFVRSVTVINEDSGWADAMSTTLYCMSVSDGLQVCKDNHLEAIWFVSKGTVDLTPDLQTDQYDIYMTDGLKDAISLS